MLPSQISRISLTLNNKGRGLAQNTGRSTELLRNKNVGWLTGHSQENSGNCLPAALEGEDGLQGTENLSSHFNSGTFHMF